MVTAITSKRHFIRFYLTLFFIFIFFASMGFMTLGLFVHLYRSAEFETRNYGLILLFILITVAAVYIFYRYFKTAPSIEINTEVININHNSYDWSNLEKVELTGKRPFIFFYSKEGLSLKFSGQKEINILDDSYSNLNEIKLFVKHYIIDKGRNPMVSITSPDASEIYYEQFIFYKNSQFLNFRGIILWLITGGLLYASLIQNNRGVLIFLLGLAILVFFGISYFLYYFGISENYFIVKNHDRFWARRIYRLGDIKEIVFEQQDRWPNCLIVITNDFKTDFFPAATLWNSKWRELKADFEKKNVKVRSEIYLG